MALMRREPNPKDADFLIVSMLQHARHGLNPSSIACSMLPKAVIFSALIRFTDRQSGW
jgi:hypothetical protein